MSMSKAWFKKEWRENKYGWFSAGLSFLLRFLYSFFGTKYRSYVINDMRWYYERALEFARGDFTSPHQWESWPPFYHMILGSIIKLGDIFHFSSVRFEVILILQMLLCSVSVYVVFRIAKRILEDTSWAGIISGLYAFAYPLILYSGLILSENIAIPLVIFSVWFLVEPASRGAGRSFFLSGLFLSLASAIRPATSLYILPFLWFAWKNSRYLKLGSAWRFFMTGYLSFAILATGYVYIVSGGKISGVSTNGGINLFLRQCRVKMLDIKADGIEVAYSPVQFYDERYSNLFRLETRVPPYEQSFYAKTAWECLRHGGWHLILADLVETVKLVWGYAFFPWFGDAFQIKLLLNIWIWSFLFIFIVALLGAFSRKVHSGEQGNFVKFISGLMGCVGLTAFVFPVEQRFMYPLIFLVYILAALTVRRRILDRKQKP